MSEWREVTLGKVAELAVGPAFKSSEFTENPSDVRLLRGINVGVGRISWSTTKYWPSHRAGDFARFRLKVGDLILAMDRPWIDAGLKLTAVRSGDVPALLVQRVARLRATGGVHQAFLRAVVATDQFAQYLKGVTSGTAVPHISPGDIQDFSLRVPSDATQRRIASVISAFDELIEINDRRIEVLEDLARSLYREWFVGLRFPGHEDAELVDSELGSIPEGWEVRRLGDVCEVVRGRSYRRAELSDTEGVPFLNLKCVARGGGFRRSGLKRYTGSHTDAQKAVAGDVLVAVTDMTQERRIVAQAFRMPDLGSSFAVPSLDLALLKPSDQRARTFLYGALRYSEFSGSVRHFANGANVLHLGLERILEYLLLVPGQRVIADFGERVDHVLGEAEALEAQSRALASTRDFLLPHLVTGRLDISDLDLGDLLPSEAA